MTKKCKKCGWSRVTVYLWERYHLEVNPSGEQIGSKDVERVSDAFEATQAFCGGCGLWRDDISQNEIDEILFLVGCERKDKNEPYEGR